MRGRVRAAPRHSVHALATREATAPENMQDKGEVLLDVLVETLVESCQRLDDFVAIVNLLIAVGHLASVAVQTASGRRLVSLFFDPECADPTIIADAIDVQFLRAKFKSSRIKTWLTKTTNVHIAICRLVALEFQILLETKDADESKRVGDIFAIVTDNDHASRMELGMKNFERWTREAFLHSEMMFAVVDSCLTTEISLFDEMVKIKLEKMVQIRVDMWKHRHEMLWSRAFCDAFKFCWDRSAKMLQILIGCRMRAHATERTEFLTGVLDNRRYEDGRDGLAYVQERFATEDRELFEQLVEFCAGGTDDLSIGSNGYKILPYDAAQLDRDFASHSVVAICPSFELWVMHLIGCLKLGQDGVGVWNLRLGLMHMYFEYEMETHKLPYPTLLRSSCDNPAVRDYMPTEYLVEQLKFVARGSKYETFCERVSSLWDAFRSAQSTDGRMPPPRPFVKWSAPDIDGTVQKLEFCTLEQWRRFLENPVEYVETRDMYSRARHARNARPGDPSPPLPGCSTDDDEHSW